MILSRHTHSVLSLWTPSPCTVNAHRGMRKRGFLRRDHHLTCAYLWATAVPTCLHIPMQLNMACFLRRECASLALALSRPALPMLSAKLWTQINATPSRGPLRTLAGLKARVNTFCWGKDRENLTKSQIFWWLFGLIHSFFVYLHPKSNKI
jgi:hypothetical protein